MAKKLVNPVNASGVFITSSTPNTLTTLVSITGKSGNISRCFINQISTGTGRLKVTVDGATTVDLSAISQNALTGFVRNTHTIDAINYNSRFPNTFLTGGLIAATTVGYPVIAASKGFIYLPVPIPFTNSILIEIAHSSASNSFDYEYSIMTE